MQTLYRFRFAVLVLVLLGLVLLWPGIRRAVQVDNSLQAWFIKDDPALQAFYQFQEHFGNDEIIFLLFESAQSSIQVEELKSLAKLEAALEGHQDVAQVISPLDLRLAPRNAFEAEGPLWLRPEDMSPSQLEERIESQAFFKEQFFSAENKALKLIIKLELSPDFEERRAEILQDLYTITDKYVATEQSFFGGLSVIYEAMNSLSQKDFSRFLGVGYLLMFLLIGLIYRSWQYVAYALLTIFLSTYFTLGIYGLMGHRLNLLSTLIPAIIILLCVMDVMHILNERQKEAEDLPLKQAALDSLARIWKPCLFTSLSTMAGFLSLGISPVRILADFGLYAALGIGFGLLFSFWLGTLILSKVAHRQKEKRSSRALVSLQEWVLNNQRKVLAFFALAIIWGAFNLSQLKVDTNSIAYLPEDHRVRQDSRQIESLMGPYMPLEFLIETKDSVTLQDPVVLAALQKVEEEAKRLAKTGDMQGYHDLFTAAFKERYGEDWERGYTKEGLVQKLADLAERTAPEWTRSFNTADYKIGRFALSGELVSASKLSGIIDSMDRITTKHLGPYAQVKVSGYQSLYAEIVNYVTRSQVQSLSLAILLVFALLWLFLKDLRLSLISLMPNLFPILMMLGSMAALNIELDTATASIASIVLSFSIDDTMHFIWHYRKLKHQAYSLAECRKRTMAHVGRAILFTSMVLFIGYSLMFFGELKTVIYFGVLTALSILAALLSQFLLFPILLKNYDRPIKAE